MFRLLYNIFLFYICLSMVCFAQTDSKLSSINEFRKELFIGAAWKDISHKYNVPQEEVKWGEDGRLLLFNDAGSELQLYLDKNSKVEGFFTLYYDGALMGERKELLDKLAVTDGVFVKVVDEKDKKSVKFQGMAYINTDKKTNITSFLLTGPKAGYQYLYVDATYRESDLKRFNRQIFEQIRKKVRWESDNMRHK